MYRGMTEKSIDSKFLEKHGTDVPEYIGEYVKMMKSALS